MNRMAEKKVSSFYLKPETIRLITKLSDKEDRSKSSVIDRAIKLYAEVQDE